MKIAIAATLSLALLAAGAHAQEPTPAAAAGAKDAKVSYAIGVNIANSIKSNEASMNLKVDPAALAQGIQDAVADKPDAAKMSYAIGVNIAGSLKSEEIDPAVVIEGLKAAFDGKATQTNEQAIETLKAFGEAQQAKALAAQEALGVKNKEASAKFLAENAKKEGVKATASGLQYKILKEGAGPKPKATDTVTVNYTGTLIDGKTFDTNKGKPPVSFPLNQVIPGWTEGLQLIPVGSTCLLVVPAELAYGENAPPSIGPNQALIFEVELLKAEAAELPEAPAK